VSAPEVVDVPEQERYELRLDGEVVGYAEYRGGRAPTRVMTHTEIAPGHEGQGLASILIAGALDDLREKELAVMPLCPFVKAFLARPEHRDYLRLVPPHVRASMNLPPG